MTRVSEIEIARSAASLAPTVPFRQEDVAAAIASIVNAGATLACAVEVVIAAARLGRPVRTFAATIAAEAEHARE